MSQTSIEYVFSESTTYLFVLSVGVSELSIVSVVLGRFLNENRHEKQNNIFKEHIPNVIRKLSVKHTWTIKRELWKQTSRFDTLYCNIRGASKSLSLRSAKVVNFGATPASDAGKCPIGMRITQVTQSNGISHKRTFLLPNKSGNVVTSFMTKRAKILNHWMQIGWESAFFINFSNCPG